MDCKFIKTSLLTLTACTFCSCIGWLDPSPHQIFINSEYKVSYLVDKNDSVFDFYLMNRKNNTMEGFNDCLLDGCVSITYDCFDIFAEERYGANFSQRAYFQFKINLKGDKIGDFESISLSKKEYDEKIASGLDYKTLTTAELSKPEFRRRLESETVKQTKTVK